MIDLESKLLTLYEVQRLKSVGNLPSKWHSYPTIYDHTLKVVELVKDTYATSKVMMASAFLHDIGKSATRIEKNGYITFPGHAEASTEMSEPIIEGLLKKGLISPEEAESIIFIVENHMRPIRPREAWTNPSVKRFIKKMGERLTMLLRFADLDIRGSNPDRIPKSGWTAEIKSLKEAIITIQ